MVYFPPFKFKLERDVGFGITVLQLRRRGQEILRESRWNRETADGPVRPTKSR